MNIDAKEIAAEAGRASAESAESAIRTDARINF
jgi:hypothetical protein